MERSIWASPLLLTLLTVSCADLEPTVAPSQLVRGLAPGVSPELSLGPSATANACGGSWVALTATTGVALVLFDNYVPGRALMLASRFRASDGLNLDPGGLVVAEGQSSTGARAVAAIDESQFLTAYVLDGALYARRVRATDGALLDAAAIPMSDGAEAVSTACTGGACVVVWVQHTSVRSGIYARRVASDGHVLDSAAPIDLSPNRDAHHPSVAAALGEFLIVWDIQGDILSRRLRSADGMLLESSPRAVASSGDGEVEPVTASDGRRIMIVWHDLDRSALIARGMMSGSGVLDSDFVPVLEFPPSPFISERLLSLTYAPGQQYLLSWLDNSGTAAAPRARRFTPDRAPLDGPLVGGGVQLRTDPDSMAVVIAGTGSEVWLASIRVDGVCRSQLLTALDPVSLARTASSEILNTQATPQLPPAVAKTASHALAAWFEPHSESLDLTSAVLRVARLEPRSGRALDRPALDIAEVSIPDSFAPPSHRPALAGLGGQFMAAWRERRTIRLAFIDAEHATSRTSSLAWPVEGSGFTLAAGGDSYLLLWLPGAGGLLGVRFDSASHRPIDEAPLVLLPPGGPGYASEPSAACQNMQCLVAWKEWDGNNVGEVRAARVSLSDGEILDPLPLPIGPGHYTLSPHVATDGSDYLVVFQHLFDSDETASIGAVRVRGADGQVLDPLYLEVSSATRDQALPSVSFVGSSYLVVWADQRNAPTGASAEIRAARVKPDGNLLDGSPETGSFVVVPAMDIRQSNLPFTQVAGASDAIALVGYASYGEAMGRSLRAWVRAIELSDIGESCAVSADCVSGFCVDGVCCSTACGGGNAGDCMACSVRAGGTTDGVCGTAQGWTCRPSIGPCDPAELCEASSLQCPVDLQTACADAGVTAEGGDGGDGGDGEDGEDGGDGGDGASLVGSGDSGGLGEAAVPGDAGLETHDASRLQEEPPGACGCSATSRARPPRNGWVLALALVLLKRHRHRWKQ